MAPPPEALDSLRRTVYGPALEGLYKDGELTDDELKALVGRWWHVNMASATNTAAHRTANKLPGPSFQRRARGGAERRRRTHPARSRPMIQAKRMMVVDDDEDELLRTPVQNLPRRSRRLLIPPGSDHRKASSSKLKVPATLDYIDEDDEDYVEDDDVSQAEVDHYEVKSDDDDEDSVEDQEGDEEQEEEVLEVAEEEEEEEEENVPAEARGEKKPQISWRNAGRPAVQRQPRSSRASLARKGQW